MSIFESIINNFNEHMDLTSRHVESLTPYIAESVNLITETLLAGNKILCCTSPTSIAAGHQFCDTLLHCADLERPALPALLLGSDNHSNLYKLGSHKADEIFSSQIQLFGKSGDALYVISMDDKDKSVINAINTAQELGINIISLTTDRQTIISSIVSNDQVNMILSSQDSGQLIRLQFLISHLLAQLTEQQLFGSH